MNHLLGISMGALALAGGAGMALSHQPQRSATAPVVVTTAARPAPAGPPAIGVDLTDPDVPACRADGGTPVAPPVGGGGGPGAPVDFCLLGGHMWGPGGDLGPPWGTTVAGAAECALLGGTFDATVDPETGGYDCTRR